jgi:dTDP-4-dehydrorhamnose reductase
MKVLLTGTAGQLGRHLRASAPSAIELVTSARSGGDRACDLADPEAVESLLEQIEPDLIINAAAWTAVDDAEDHPDAAHRLNADLPGWLADWCGRRDAALISYSTDYVFSGQPGRAWQEGDAPAPDSVYGHSKLAGEQRILASGARALVLRTAWVYSALRGNFLSAILARAATGADLRVVADQVGSPTWAGDLARATWQLVERRIGRLESPELLHVAGVGAVSWHAFAELAVAEAAARGLIEQSVKVEAIGSADWPQKARRPAWSVLDSSRCAALCGQPMMNFEAALNACLDQWTNPPC